MAPPKPRSGYDVFAADEVDEGEGEGELDVASSVEVDPVVDVNEQALERVITKLAPTFSVF